MIPAMGVVSAGAAVGLGATAPVDAVAAGAAGAALAAAIRALAGDAVPALIGAVLAPLLLIATLFDPVLAGSLAFARGGVAIAAAAWTLVELSRPSSSPLVALLPATVAALLDPGCVALVPIAGLRLMTAPWERPRWAIAVPIAGGLAVVLALVAHTARAGWLADLALRWSGPSAHTSPGAFALLAGTVLGPITAVAAIAGLPALARPRHAEIAAVSWFVGALLIGARAGAAGPLLIGGAALLAGLAIGRLAALVRLASGQVVLGVTAALLVLLPPAWTAVQPRIERVTGQAIGPRTERPRAGARAQRLERTTEVAGGVVPNPHAPR